MSVEENKAIVKRWFDEAMLGGNPDVVDELFAEKIVVHGKNDETTEQSREDKRQYLKGAENFVDLNIPYDDPSPFGEGDIVAFRWIATGKNAKSGEAFCYTHNYLYRIANGRIAEEWHCYF